MQLKDTFVDSFLTAISKSKEKEDLCIFIWWHWCRKHSNSWV